MKQLDVFSTLVGLAYDAALTPDAWVQFLKLLTERFGAEGAQILYADHDRRELSINISYGFSNDIISAHERLAFEDPLIPDIFDNKNAIMHHVFDELPEDFKNTRFVKELIFANRIRERATFVSEISETETIGFGILVGDQGARITDADLEFLQRLQPHIVRSIEIHKEVADLQGNKARQKRALDALPIGVMILNQKAEIVFENNAAATITSDCKYFWRAGKTLGFMSASTDKALRDALRSITTTAAADTTTLRVETGDASDILFFTLAAADPEGSPESTLIYPESTAIAYIFDPRVKVETTEQLVGRMFGLTNAEARTMLSMVQGETTNQIADKYGLSIETIRTYVKRILQKTGCQKQSDVIRIVVNSPAWLRHHAKSARSL